jgi:hypothetical protein
MSDDTENDPKPMKKTSAVPLRKETVRVTLKADPKDSSAPKPPSPPAGGPPAPAPTIPLKTSGPGAPKPPSPAPTVQLQSGASSTKPAAPAPTVKLNTPAATTPVTQPLTGGSSQPLPKATVQLQQTQSLGSATGTPSQAATIRTAEDDDADAGEDGASTALSVVALIAALIVLGVQLSTASIWVDGEWGKLFE